MITIAELIKLVLTLGFVVQVESVDSLDNAVKYYNEDTKTVYDCVVTESDIGKISVCQSSENSAKIFVPPMKSE